MSLWFRPQQSTFSPSNSRTMGFGQVPAARAAFNNEEQGSPQETAAASGVTPSFGSRISIRNDIDNTWQFDGPNFNNMTFGFNTEINNNILQNYEINYVVGEVAGTGGGGGGAAFACTDLVGCGGGDAEVRLIMGTFATDSVAGPGPSIVLTPGVGLQYKTRTATFQNGLLVGIESTSTTHTITTTTCA